jgi:hypothetical protein
VRSEKSWRSGLSFQKILREEPAKPTRILDPSA